MLQAPTSATLVPDVDESVDFTQAQHVFIEGENLETSKVIYRAYFGRVKMIYLDPPYNTGNDFIYPDNFADPLDHYPGFLTKGLNEAVSCAINVVRSTSYLTTGARPHDHTV